MQILKLQGTENCYHYIINNRLKHIKGGVFHVVHVDLKQTFMCCMLGQIGYVVAKNGCDSSTKSD